METKTSPAYYIVIDFDSTFMQVEALEELADIVLKNSADKPRILEEIKQITNLGVDGKITFNESLSRRLNLLRVHREHLEKLVRRLKRKVSVSFSRNKEFFHRYKEHIYIISAGFKDFIEPVVEPFGIEPEYVLANTFTFDENGWVTGYDRENPLAYSKGKSKTLQRLGLEGEIYVIGDAYTDFEMVEAGMAHKFFAFTENVLRENILEKADHVTPSFDEFLYVNQMPRALSYPKNRIRVLLPSETDERAREAFRGEGYQLEYYESSETLSERIKGISILGLASGMSLGPELLRQADRLMGIGVFGVNSKNIDLGACARQGVIVFDAPYNHTRSQVELAIGQIIALLRRVPGFQRQMQAGQWPVSPATGLEIRGKRLGIVGYGHSGQQLSVLAEALGMDVYYCDVVDKPALGNATKVDSLKELLKKAEIVSLHIDNRPENKNFFNKAALRAMRDQSVLINLSNGAAVDLAELAAQLRSGRLLGAAIDVFPQEPFDQNQALFQELTSLDNLLLTPHIGGNTREAHQNTAAYIPAQLIEYINSGSTAGSLNFPRLRLPSLKKAHRLIHIHENRPGILARINSVLAEHEINILGQYLKTNEQIGYVITDIDKQYEKKVLGDLKGVEHTIKFRVLY